MNKAIDQREAMEVMCKPRLSLPHALLLTAVVFLSVQALCWIFVGEYSFPNAPSMLDTTTAYSRWLMIDLAIPYKAANALDFTNPAPRGIIAFILAFCTFKLARAKVIK
ncbi:hypothetical protein [Thalassotalea hakodatensis]|uniref:hypothetical protein n=1 Tax=Thalassotalea hakodatensis TaxID=3030492 RepID=UPI0025747AAC|nr:hypothetical protein [Thalassotalea hakodatensis]